MRTASVFAAAGRPRVTAVAGAAASIVSAGLLLAASVPPAPLIGALVLACVPAGAAVMCWVDAGEAAAQAALVLGVSLALFGLFSAGLIWTGWWHPPVLLGLAGLSLLSCGIRLSFGGDR